MPQVVAHVVAPAPPETYDILGLTVDEFTTILNCVWTIATVPLTPRRELYDKLQFGPRRVIHDAR
jgi:hypothetical protein